MRSFHLIIPLFFALRLQPALAETPGPETLAALVKGDVVLLDTSADSSGGSARVQVLAQAPARAVWDVIISCELAFVFVEGIETCEVLESSPGRALVHQVVKKGWPIPTQDYVFESLREPYLQIRFGLVEGNLKAMEGLWRFIELPEGLLVDYEVRIEPGIPAPKFLVRRNIRKNMPDLVACIRGLAGGSGSREVEVDDLDRCPGDPGLINSDTSPESLP
jgi:hypothetical protein